MENNVPSEQELLESARKFDHQALARVYDLYSPGLYRYAMRSLSEPDRAEECVAETFSRFLQAMRNGKGPREYLMAYLYQIAHNWIVDQYRRIPDVEQLEEDTADPSQNIETEVETRLSDERLRAAIHKLTAEQQQVIVMKYMEDLDNQEIARILRKPIGAIKSLQHRALASLQRILQEKQ
jgi:RNA polymerase sigma-70 factor (ECF subfamily)